MNPAVLQAIQPAFDAQATFSRAFRMAPLSWQEGFLDSSGNVVVLKGRQVGASTSAAAIALHVSRFRPGSLAVIVSPSQRQSQEIAIRAKAGLRNLERAPLEQDSVTTIGLANGSRIMSLPGTEASIRGYSADLLIVDEAARVEESTWVSARALVATGGRVIAISTPAGAAGWFYDLWSGSDNWTRIRVRTDEVPTVSPEWLAQERRSMSEADYKSEYAAEFVTAGLGGYFNPEALAAATREVAVPMLARLKEKTA